MLSPESLRAIVSIAELTVASGGIPDKSNRRNIGDQTKSNGSRVRITSDKETVTLGTNHPKLSKLSACERNIHYTIAQNQTLITKS
jgi:hypothetical protein